MTDAPVSITGPLGVRDRLAADLEAEYEAVRNVIREAMQAKKRVRVERDCIKCGCSHIDFVEVQDVNAAIKAAEFWSNQGLGRPAEESSRVESGGFVVERFVVEPGELVTQGGTDA